MYGGDAWWDVCLLLPHSCSLPPLRLVPQPRKEPRPASPHR